MIILIRNSKIHSIYHEIPIDVLVAILAEDQDFSVVETPNDNSISFEIGIPHPVSQDISAELKSEIRSKTAKFNRKIREETGILWKNSLIKPTTETLSNLVMAKSQVQQGNISRVPWRFDDGNFQELTMDDLDELIRIISQTIQENFSNERQEVIS